MINITKGSYEDIHVTSKKPKKTPKKPKHVCTNFIEGTIKIENQCRIQRYTEGLNALIESHQVVQTNYRTALACICGIQFVSYTETVTSKNNNSMLKWRIFMPFLHLHKMHFRENPYNTKMIHYCLESISLLLSLACFT